MDSRDEAVYLLALVRAYGRKWHRIAALVEVAGTARGIVEGEVQPPNEFAREVQESVKSRHVEEAAREVHSWSQRPDMKAWTVLDNDYPSSLHTIFNRPPFLFCRGNWDDRVDSLGLAVVGTRKPTGVGLSQARRMAGELAKRDVTVISGLALGIDGAAHEAALDRGGRTIAVLGSGLDEVYPQEHIGLADRIVAEGGALLSQFLPGQPPSRTTFPMRNAVMSGLGRGTIVIEADERSGAKMQARLALEHGRTLFLLESLVERNAWARDYVERGRYGTTPIVVKSIDEVLHELSPPPESLLQMKLLLSASL